MSALREATLAVVRAALAGGHLTPDELRLALLVQERLGTCDDPALVLPLLRWKFLPAESLPSLTGVYKRTVAASRGPAPPPPVLQPSQREQAGELLEQGDELLLTHPDLDPPDVQAFLLEADAARFSDPPPSARLGQIPDPSSTARVLEESDEGALELGLDTSLSDVLADSDLPHAASSSGGSGELFEESDEGPLELVSSSVEAPAAPRFESEDASDIPSDASDIPSDASSDLLEIDAWSDAPEAEPLDDSSDAPTTPPAGADWGTSARLAAESADAPQARPTTRRERRPRTGRQRRATRQTPRPEPPASSARATPTRASASPGERGFEFRGSAWRLLLWQLLGTITFAGTLLTLLAGLPGCGWRPAERAMALVFLRLPALKALALHVQSSLSSPPPWALVLGAGLLLVVACVASNAVRLYRTNHTYVYGMRLTCQEGWGLGEDAIALALTLLTAGLALPWVVARRRRWFYRSCHVRGTNLALEFRGTGLQALGLILLTALALPLVVLSLGVLALRVQLWWIAWERGRLWIPDADGRLHPARFEASGPDYVKHMAPRQLATLLSLGLYRPWALVAAWRWLDRRTHID